MEPFDASRPSPASRIALMTERYPGVAIANAMNAWFPSLDDAEADRMLPHPVYAAQHWGSIVNPSEASLQSVVIPLLDEAHGRLAAQRASHDTDA